MSRVCVIGAGLAGLTAAEALQAAGLEPVEHRRGREAQELGNLAGGEEAFGHAARDLLRRARASHFSSARGGQYRFFVKRL